MLFLCIIDYHKLSICKFKKKNYILVQKKNYFLSISFIMRFLLFTSGISVVPHLVIGFDTYTEKLLYIKLQNCRKILIF